jgi:hypothetical protein
MSPGLIPPRVALLFHTLFLKPRKFRPLVYLHTPYLAGALTIDPDYHRCPGSHGVPVTVVSSLMASTGLKANAVLDLHWYSMALLIPPLSLAHFRIHGDI